MEQERDVYTVLPESTVASTGQLWATLKALEQYWTSASLFLFLNEEIIPFSSLPLYS